MNDSNQRQLIAETARGLIFAVAPQEMPLFRATSEAYFKNPGKVLKRHASKDEMLGFGTGQEIALLTPIALAVTTEVVNFVWEEVQKSAKADGAAAIRDLVNSLFMKFRSRERVESGPDAVQAAVQPRELTPPRLTPEQLAQVRRLAFEEARRLRLSEPRAHLLADAMVGGLASA